MSFMFKPLDLDDKSAVNYLQMNQEIINDITFGTTKAAVRLAKEFKAEAANKGLVVAINGYASANFKSFADTIAQSLMQAKTVVKYNNMTEFYKPISELNEMLEDSLPLNYEDDPVLLFGKLYEGQIEDFFDRNKLPELYKRVAALDVGEVMLLYGYGSASSFLSNLVDVVVYIDVTPKIAAIRARNGRLINIGDSMPRPFKELMRRNYYVDFEVILQERKELLVKDRIDYYICGDKEEEFVLMQGTTMNTILANLVKQPFRTKPVYLEGIWGGEYIRKVRKLPMQYKNIAWVFDMIPMEVSIVAQMADKQVEFPFFTLIQKYPTQLMGEKCATEFEGYFPIRFNYDDTYHSNGNMSVQVHPDEALCMSMYNEKGRQDEAYYIVATAHDAKTYLGFNKNIDPQAFLELAKQSEVNGTDIDYAKYINYIESTPGRQVMIPGGTIHASGRNQLILELGSLTIGSYTYKMYDYNRRESDGTLRPIHSKMGQKALYTERNTDWVNENIAITPIPDGKGDGWEQYILGQTDLMYYMTKHTKMDAGAKAEFSNHSQFTVLTLVDGEHIKVYSKSNPDFCYYQNYLDIVVVPATITDYVIENIGYQPAVVHKTMLKDVYKRFLTR